ncbi:hypothetical protein [Paenibacillus sp. Y412MC10]|uniref:hypothetical protein n=1 Tax=Geobacillus sp. (strain Y412MC10) TaxID=481743 RepID=UPI0011AB6D67|nr:hypothetical protein [Paenibacillus sp. Y412MC10]
MKKYIIVIVLFILVIAAITVPDKKQYAEWIKEEVKKQSNDQLVSLGVDILGFTIFSSTSTCKNYVFFSVCKTDLGQDDKVIAIGAFNNYLGMPYK